jgi:hypothetical protein
VLIPLAQGRSSVGDWLAAVEASGPSTPLSDPMFVGTVFIPHNEVRNRRSSQQLCCDCLGSPQTLTLSPWWLVSVA